MSLHKAIPALPEILPGTTVPSASPSERPWASQPGALLLNLGLCTPGGRRLESWYSLCIREDAEHSCVQYLLCVGLWLVAEKAARGKGKQGQAWPLTKTRSLKYSPLIHSGPAAATAPTLSSFQVKEQQENNGKKEKEERVDLLSWLNIKTAEIDQPSRSTGEWREEAIPLCVRGGYRSW